MSPSLHAGSVVECRHVIVTVPILMLQQERIRFSPPLPADKTGAISRVKMSNAMKVIRHTGSHTFIGHWMLNAIRQ